MIGRIRKLSALLERRRAKTKQSFQKLLFNNSMHAGIRENHEKTITDAEMALENKHAYECAAAYLASSDPLVQQGRLLKKNVENDFKDIYVGEATERILIHVPESGISPAGYSIFTNLAESLIFLGVPTCILGWEGGTKEVLERFKPTIFLSSDHESYLERIDWNEIRRYKNSNSLKIGLTASLAEYDNTPLNRRLAWSETHGVDFFYSFRDEGYVGERLEYRPFIDAGYKILYLPFGANILNYYPVAGFERDINYVLIASRKREHAIYMKNIVKNTSGFIDGPGWKHAPYFCFNRERDRYIYARAKVGLNVHLPEQLESACEVNERTYQLAACGVPQLIDHPKLIDKIFSQNAMFVADTPEQYADLFTDLMKNPALGQERALVAQKEVFSQHTTFHRAESFMRQLIDL